MRAASHLAAAAPSPEEIRRAAEEILSRPEFQAPPKSLYDQAIEALGDAVGKLLGALVSGGAGAVVGWVVLLGLAAALGYLGYRLMGAARGRPRRATSRGPVIEVDEKRTAAEWLADARRMEEAGRWPEALRCRYRALVTTLVAGGVVDDVAGRTAGEYRVAVAAARPPVAGDFTGATRLFERAWYGREGTEEQSAEFARLAERVVAGSAAP